MTRQHHRPRLSAIRASISAPTVATVALFVAAIALLSVPTASAQGDSGDDKQRTGVERPMLAPDIVGQASVGQTTPNQMLVPDRAPDARLLLTGGLGGLHDGLNAFFRSPLFRAGQSVPLRIQDATTLALVSSDAVFFAQAGVLDESLLLKASDATEKEGQATTVLMGPSAIAFAPKSEALTGPEAKLVRRSMAAVEKTLAVEVATVGDIRVYGLALAEGEAVQWPTSETPLTQVPSAIARFQGGTRDGARLHLVARRHASTPRLFGELDRLLARDRDRSAFVDVGGTLTSGEDASAASIAAMEALLDARHPVALTVGRAELVAAAAAPNRLARRRYLVAANGMDLPAHRLATIGKTRVLFVAVGGLGRQAIGLLPAGATGHSTAFTITAAQTLAASERADVVIGIALSSAGERAALKAPIFDMVLHLTSSRVRGLPAQDLVDVRRNHAAGAGTGATLVRHSRSDVTEVKMWRGPRGGLETILIGRTSIVGEGPEASDALTSIRARNERRGWIAREGLGLSARAALDDAQTVWSGTDLTRLLGSMIRENTGADISVIGALDEPLEVEGRVPLPLARSWLAVDGRLRRARVRGDALRKIFGALSSGTLNGRFYVNGGSRGGGTVQERPIADLEHYDVVFSPELGPALKEVGVTLAADAADTADPMPLVGALVQQALLSGISADAAENALKHADGVAEHVFVAELADVGLTTSLHRIQGNDNFGAVRDSRVLTPNYWAIGVNGRATLAYDGPYNYSALVATSQFARQEQEGDGRVVIQEARDTLLFEAESRLLLKRVLDSSPRFTPEPGLRVSYQTEWTPNLVDGGDGTVIEQKRRAELRGFAGATLRPTPIFEEVRAGAIVENDFASEVEGALEWGGEAAVRGKYNVWMLQISLDGFLRGYVPDPERDTPDDLLVVGQAIVRAELPIVYGLRLGVFADAYLAMGKVAEVRGPATSLIIGASLSYGERLKFVPFRP